MNGKKFEDEKTSTEGRGILRKSHRNNLKKEEKLLPLGKVASFVTNPRSKTQIGETRAFKKVFAGEKERLAQE